MTETIIRKAKRRFHLLSFISPYRLSEEQKSFIAIADLGRSADAFIERMGGLYA